MRRIRSYLPRPSWTRSRRLGIRCDGRVLALNSYENRVYQIGIEEGEPLVAKFYRPGRWSDAAIREEHAFSANSPRRRFPWSPLSCSTANRCIRIKAFVMRFFRGAADAGRNSEIAMSANGWADSSDASMRWGAPAGFSDRGALSMEDLGRNARDCVLEGRLDAGLSRDQVRRCDRRTLGCGGCARAGLGRRGGGADTRAIATAAIFCGPI